MAQYRKDLNQYLNQEKTLFETVMIADQFGNMVGSNPSGMAVDAFGRARMAQPLTLFDSFHRYQDNGKISTANNAGTSFAHDANSSSIVCTVGTANGHYVYRESNKVFAYQPGKSLQILETFVMAPPQTGLRQRYGYFGSQNGVFLEQDGFNVYFVRRSFSNGSLSETRVAQADWNVDTLDGTNTGAWTENPPTPNRNPSGLRLDLTKAQILFHDIEWLGVGSVRCGFVINGKFVHCHTWQHANLITNTYMTTACLPVRCEIENTAATGNTSNLRIICATVISEGGYELTGKPRTAGHLPNSVVTLTTAGVDYTVMSIRLKSERSDAIVIPRQINILGVSTNPTRLRYKVVTGANTVGGTWVSAGTDSAVQYNLGTSVTSGIGTEVRSGYIAVTNQSAGSISLDANLFKLQLERNSFANTNTSFNIVVSGATNGDQCVASIDWEEVT